MPAVALDGVAFVIFGVTGDLARRKLFPALCRLEQAGLLPPGLVVDGVGRRPWDTAAFARFVEEALAQFAPDLRPEAVRRFTQRLRFIPGGVDPEGIGGVARALPPGMPTVFYLALPPGLFAEAARELAAADLHRQEGGFRRLVVEKPFGSDLASARTLEATVRRRWREEQVFRIDHFLLKETVQNLLVFRFANTFLEPIWNRHYIDHVQITVAETGGLDGRARYYDASGALRDMVQNHLIQLFTLTAMEPPARLEGDSLRDEKVKVLKSVRPLPAAEVDRLVVRGRYGPGHVDGQPVRGYLEEEGVRPGSLTETYVALRLHVDNWRWRGVPFYLRTGKRLAADRHEVAIRFKSPPHQLFEPAPFQDIEPNWLILSMKPAESLSLVVQAKQVGLELVPRTVVLQAPYREEGEREVEAYESLILDVLRGDRTYFLRYDEVDWAWQVLQPILERWAADPGPPVSYPAGSDGPAGAEELLAAAGHRWRPLR